MTGSKLTFSGSFKLPKLEPHYRTEVARLADIFIHVAALFLAVAGASYALWIVTNNARSGDAGSIFIYSSGLIAMFGLSAAYNFASPERQPFLRRLDHAGVFLMIAASYTPFTTQALTGSWAIGMTIAVWALAGIGIFGKLMVPDLGKMYWIGFYLVLGWLVVIAVGPLMRVVPFNALALLVCGGVAYSVGTIFYANKRLVFRRAVWHAHVLAGAGMHYFAILYGVILKDANG